MIRNLQPDAVIMGKGPDVRWVGNEGGVGAHDGMERHPAADVA